MGLRWVSREKEKAEDNGILLYRNADEEDRDDKDRSVRRTKGSRDR